MEGRNWHSYFSWVWSHLSRHVQICGKSLEVLLVFQRDKKQELKEKGILHQGCKQGKLYIFEYR